MSKYNLTRKISHVGGTFRVLMCSDDAKRSLYVTKSDRIDYRFKLSYNVEGNIRVMHSNTTKFHNYFKRMFLTEGVKTRRRATAIYSDVLRHAVESNTGHIDILSHGFRVVTNNLMALSISDIEAKLNTNCSSLTKH